MFIKKRDLYRICNCGNRFRFVDNLCPIKDHLELESWCLKPTSEASFLDISIITKNLFYSFYVRLDSCVPSYIYCGSRGS